MAITAADEARPNVIEMTTMPAAVVPAIADALPRISGTIISSVPVAPSMTAVPVSTSFGKLRALVATTTGKTLPQAMPTVKISASAAGAPGTTSSSATAVAAVAVIGISVHGSKRSRTLMNRLIVTPVQNAIGEPAASQSGQPRASSA